MSLPTRGQFTTDLRKHVRDLKKRNDKLEKHLKQLKESIERLEKKVEDYAGKKDE